MIEMQRLENDEYVVLIDGIQVTEGITVNKYGSQSITVEVPEVAKRFFEKRFCDLPEKFDILHLPYSMEYIKFIDEVVIRGFLNEDEKEISFNFEFDAGNWTGIWGIRDYVEELERITKEHAESNVTIEIDKDEVITGFWLTFPIRDMQAIIEHTVAFLQATLIQFHQTAVTNLIARAQPESLVMWFDFPEVVRVPCEQYLLYFVQFLKDVGLDATADLKHEAGQVLFSVTPIDGQQALANVRQALEIYLHLPQRYGQGVMLPPSSDREMRLLANIQHLNTQAMLIDATTRANQATIQAYQATIQAQGITIQTQQQSIEDYRRLVPGEILVNSLKHVAPAGETEDKERLLGGAFSLTKVDAYGVEVNFAVIFRKLKELFKK